MKKALIGIAGLLTILLLVNIVNADIPDVDIQVNHTDDKFDVDINIQITGNDTTLRKDVYGTASNSSPKDSILTGASEDNETELREICSQPSLQAYFNQIGDIPPSGFVAYLKSLGYDDETHIAFIWSMCQQEYIKQNEGMWLQDQLGGGGITTDEMISYIQGAVNWLMKKTETPNAFKEIGSALASYFASKAEVAALRNQMQMENYALNIRLKALENTMNEIASDAYCKGKVAAMMEYNLSYVKCGINSTYYYRVDPNEYGFPILVVDTNGETPFPIDVSVSAPAFVKPYEQFDFTIELNNSGAIAGTGIVKINLLTPEGWEAKPQVTSDTLTEGEVKTKTFVIASSNSSGQIETKIKYTIKGKTYSKTLLTSIEVVQPVVEVNVTEPAEQPSLQNAVTGSFVAIAENTSNAINNSVESAAEAAEPFREFYHLLKKFLTE